MRDAERWFILMAGDMRDVGNPGANGVLKGFIKSIQADAQPQWQPIETAPRDGTGILVFIPHIPYRRGDEWGCFVAYCSMGVWWGKGIGHIGEPSHWMPLPEPPK